MMTKLTNYVIVGKGFGPSKMQKIERFQSEGFDIKVMYESDLMNEFVNIYSEN